MNNTITPINIYSNNPDENPYAIWETVIIPLVIGPAVLFAKIMFDKWKKANLIKHQIITDKIKNQLSVFYWPIYLLLMKEYDFLIHFTKDNSDELNYHSESEIEDNPDNLKKCIYEFIDKNNIVHKCKNYVSINTITKHGAYCIKHYNFKQKKLIETIEINDCAVAINIDHHNIQYRQDDNIIEINYELLLTEIKNIHLKIQNIIENNISVAEPNRHLGRQIIKYIRFITYFKSTNQSINIMNPYEIHYPKKLLPIIENIVFKLQKKYNILITNY